MKKRFLLFIVFLLLICSFGCAKSDKITHHSIVDMIYYPFEEIMKRANDAVLAKCVKIHDYPEGYREIEFEIEKRYFGEESGNILVMPDDDNTTYAVNGYSYESSIIKYEEGQRYFLILSHAHTPVVDHEEYTFIVGFIPVEGISEKSLYYGKTPAESEDELFRELTKSVENMDSYLAGYDASNNPPYNGRKYIETDNEEEIIIGSDYVLTIRIDIKAFDKVTRDRDVYYCTVLNDIKGTCERGQELIIVFPKNRVKPGEEYTVGLHLPYSEFDEKKPDPSEYINPKLLIPSSKKVFLSMSEEEIIAVLES